MNPITRKAALAATGVALAAGTMGAAPAALAIENVTADATLEASTSTATIQAPGVQEAEVSGDFAYTQAKLTKTAEITARFGKAAATLCQSLPTYGEPGSVSNLAFTVASMSGDVVCGTVSQLTAEEQEDTSDMACSCATNTAGGGAIMNAGVSGVALETLASLVGVLARA